MRRYGCWFTLVYVACLVSAWGQPSGPHIGYVYPAGGKQGATFRVAVGGQFLRGTDEADITGGGVRASVVDYVWPLDGQNLGTTARYLRNLVRKRWSVQAFAPAVKPSDDMPLLPDHPWLRDLDEKSPRELAWLRAKLFDPNKQMNTQIAEQVVLDVTIDADAVPGDRELRLVTPGGLTNPLRFEVGVLPEVCEEDVAGPGELSPPALNLPVTINGQITPGEVDHYRLQVRKGQQLVLRMQARRLVPYIADAVPGWFQAAMSLRGPKGNEVAYSDGYRFDPDPVILYSVPEDGTYGLEVRDALYRGRDDFVYRIAAGELPFVTSMFPLGGQAGSPVTAAITGWNLPAQTLPLDTRPGGETIRRATGGQYLGLYNDALYAVDTLPECVETEPNDGIADAQAVKLPVIVNGRIGKAGDVDIFRFDGQAGEQVVAEVYARRLRSPLDPLLKLTDVTGKVLAWNDDHEDKEAGLLTHHADSYLSAKLPAPGTFFVQVTDAQHHGGDAYGYRLRISAPQPDFALRLVPSSMNISPGGAAAATVYAVRKDGFAGDIDLALKDAPAGLKLNNARIPGGKDSVQMTVSAPRESARQVFPLQLEGHAQIGGVQVSRPVVPAENMMQAFAYWHLVPQQELLVTTAGSRRIPAVWRPLVPGIQLANTDPVQIPLGGTAAVRLVAPQALPDGLQTPLTALRFELGASSRGVRLRDATVGPNGVTLTLKADANASLAGDTANMIIEVSSEQDTKRLDGQPAGRKQRVSLGVLPPIAYAVVRP